MTKDRRTRLRRADLRSEISSLFGYSGSFLIIAVLTPSALFVLRYIFRESFGVEALGRWLVANRISDVSTQLLGLFIGQAFLPAFAAIHDRDAARRLVRSVMLAATIAMALVLGIFSLAPTLLINTFLSDQYLFARGAIQAYMAGDVFRVAASLLMNMSLARRRLRLAVVSELLPTFLLMAITGALIVSGWESAPFVGYVSANLAASAFFLRLWRQGRIP